MNKLVSRNPILRFKLDKKIVKALFGTVLDYATRYLHPFGSVAAAYDIYNAIPKNTVTKHLSNFYYGYDRDAHLKRLNKLKVKRNTPREITKDGKRFWLGSDGSITDLELYNKRNSPNSEPKQNIRTTTVTPKTPSYYYLNGYKDRTAGLGLRSRADVINWLKKIGTKADGIWGDKTERAYLAWLNRNGRGFKPSVDDFELQTELLTTPTTPPLTDTDIAEITGTTPTYSTTSTPQFNIIGDSGTTYSNERARDLFENVLLRTPTYKYATTFAKQGTKLVSRNPVERFLQGRNLPTAPKAEDRYRNGRRTWNTPFYKEVSSASNTFGDPFASRIAMEINNNNDTTFYETPGRWLPVKFKTRTAKSTSKVYKPIRVSDDGFMSYRVIGIDPEYETLKRRFNTAWNLAK